MLNSLNCVIQCLEQTISPDKKILADAQLMLEKCAEENVVGLGKTDFNLSRQAAGLQLKNCLTSRDVSLKEKYQRRWANLPEKSRNDVRDRLFSSLGTENIFPSCAAQCIAYIGAAELLLETQPSSEITCLENVLSELSGIVTRPANERRKEAALDSIACISQEINPKDLVNFYKLILDPILFCMENSKSTERIRLAAARALLNSLECIHPRFETEEGRDMVMQVVCDATQSTVVEESVIWLEILAKIGSFYYHHLMKYMESAIVPITLKAIVSTDSNISLQGIEFWSSLAEIEFDLASGVYDPTLADIPSYFYAEKALPKLVPLLMSVLIAWQDLPNDIDDLEEWTPFKGAASCLLLLAQCCSTKIDVYVTSQVCHLIECSNWRKRHAALWAVNSILEEMDPKRVSSAILPFMASFWELTFDEKSAKVRYAALLLISRILQVCPSLIPTALKPLIIGLLGHLDDADYRVAVVACKGISSLVNKLTSQKKEDSAQPTNSSLSRYYKTIIEKLLQCAGTSPKDLKYAAYQALVDVLLSSPDDCYGLVKRTIQTLIEKLRDEVTDSENDFTYTKLSRVIRKLKADEIQIRREFMCELISLLQSGVMKEDVFLATSTTLSSFPRNELTVHLPALITYFKSAVNFPDAFPMIVRLIGDLFCASGPESLSSLDYFCAKMFDMLAQKEVATKLRSDCIATLMDMASSVGMEHFQQHIGLTLDQLQYAASITVKKDPEHEELQEIMLRFYTALFAYTCDQASNESREWTSQPSLMEECLVGLLEFLVAIVDEDSSEMIMLASAEFVRIIFEKLGTTRAMKYLDCNSNLERLLCAAVDLADSCESNNDSDRNFALSAPETLKALK